VNHGFCSFCFGGFRFFVSLNAVNRVYGQNRRSIVCVTLHPDLRLAARLPRWRRRRRPRRRFLFLLFFFSFSLRPPHELLPQVRVQRKRR